MRGVRFPAATAALLSLCLLTAAAEAHPEGFSGLHVALNQNRIRAEITVHTRDMGRWFPPAQYPDYVADVTQEMEATIDELIEVQLDGIPLPVVAVRAFLLEVGLIEIDIDYEFPPSSRARELLVWSKHLIHLPRGHQQLLFIQDRSQAGVEPPASKLWIGDGGIGLMLLDDVLSVERDAAAVLLPGVAAGDGTTAVVGEDETTGRKQTPETDRSRRPRAGPVADRPTSRISFFGFGVEHILTGYDHLLFLAALLLVCNSLVEAAKIVTCFTVAHSITLAAVALDVVWLPGDIVEPLIALSIVLVAVENLSASAPPLWRRMSLTFLFGLIHGMGFASALRDLGLGTMPGSVMWPLLKFNLGVEAGQLAVAALLLPLLLRAKSKSERYANRIVVIGSGMVAAIGAYWFITRLIDVG